ncbi:MAG: desulfoferrodoxin [Candidatus Bathyarchaeota archaeon]|nr:MAG: desulfoferrodoxin [Candidatus Bathyarchaeota archaeon]
MAEMMQVYKCDICGNIVEVLHGGAGQLVCCGEPMSLLREKVKDTGLEKHVPVVEKVGEGVKVKVGSIPHPMEQNHYIEWIEITSDSGICRKFLKPGDMPEADFKTTAEKVKAREYCSIHGLWKS